MKDITEKIESLKCEIAELQDQLAAAQEEQEKVTQSVESYNTGKEVGSHLSALLNGMIDGGLSKEFAEQLTLQQFKLSQSPFGGMF